MFRTATEFFIDAFTGTIMLATLCAISFGAALGAVLRWILGLLFNAACPALPPGTLLANVLGGFLIGVALCVFAQFPGLHPNWRLFIITGFLGALTTFSTFTAEIGDLLNKGRYLLAAAGVGLHVCGSLGAFFLGMGAFALFRSVCRAPL